MGTCLRQESPQLSRKYRLNERQSGGQDAENRDDGADYCSVGRRQSAFVIGLIRAIGLIRVVVPTGDALIQRFPEVFVGGEPLPFLLQLSRQVLLHCVAKIGASQFLFKLRYLRVKGRQMTFSVVRFEMISFSLLTFTVGAKFV